MMQQNLLGAQPCQFTRSMLQQKMAESNFGQNQAAFAMYFQPSSNPADLQPVCKVCGQGIGYHNDGSPVMMQQQPQKAAAGELPAGLWMPPVGYPMEIDPIYGGGGGASPSDPYSPTNSVRSNYSATASSKNSCGENCSLYFAWIFSLGLWFHFLMIGLCETTPTLGMCQDYYYQKNTDWSRGTRYTYTIHAWYFWLVFGILYLLYFSQALCSPTRRYLSHTIADAGTYISDVRKKVPTIWWHISCYHYETRTRTDSKGHSHTERVRVTTHTASSQFNFTSWSDISQQLELPASEQVLRLRMSKTFSCADEITKRIYDAEFSVFVLTNTMDVHQDITSGVNIDGFEDYVLINPKQSFLFTLKCFWLMTFLTLGIFYRQAFMSLKAVDHKIVKQVQRS